MVGTMTVNSPTAAVRALRAVAATADQLATQAAMAAFAWGGNAVDAAIAANAAIAVTAPHLCGMGGDLLAVVRTPDGEIVALNASGRAGSGADADALRQDGHQRDAVPPRHPLGDRPRLRRRMDGAARALRAPRPGGRAGPGDQARRRRIPCQSPARRLARSSSTTPHGTNLAVLAEQAADLVRRYVVPASRLALQAIVNGGRSAFYLGAFGEGLIDLGQGLFTEDDLARVQAELGRTARHGRARRAARHHRTQLAGLPGARCGPLGRRARRARRSRRSSLAAPAHRDRPPPPRWTARPCSTTTPTAPHSSNRSPREPRSSTASERAGVRPPPCRVTPPTSAPLTTRAWPSASSSPTHRASGRGWSSRRPASTSTTAASGSAPKPVTQPSTGRVGGRRTRCARPWRRVTASSSPSSARWAAMRSRRSSSS